LSAHHTFTPLNQVVVQQEHGQNQAAVRTWNFSAACGSLGFLSGILDVVGLADLVVRCGGTDVEHIVVLRLIRHRRRRRRCSLAKNTYYSVSKKQEAGSGEWIEERGKEGDELCHMEGRKKRRITHSWRSAGRREPIPHRPIFPVMRTPRQQSWAEGSGAGATLRLNWVIAKDNL